jgi:hypothetical protein
MQIFTVIPGVKQTMPSFSTVCSKKRIFEALSKNYSLSRAFSCFSTAPEGIPFINGPPTSAGETTKLDTNKTARLHSPNKPFVVSVRLDL